MPLEMTVERLSPQCAVAVIRGGLTLGTSLKTVEGMVQQLIADGVRQLVLDMADCGYSDSAGLGFLIHIHGLAAQKGGAMRMCAVAARVKEMLTMTRTDAILVCDQTRAESLQALGCEGSAAPVA